jgi:hypothetical protein
MAFASLKRRISSLTGGASDLPDDLTLPALLLTDTKQKYKDVLKHSQAVTKSLATLQLSLDQLATALDQMAETTTSAPTKPAQGGVPGLAERSEAHSSAEIASQSLSRTAEFHRQWASLITAMAVSIRDRVQAPMVSFLEGEVERAGRARARCEKAVASHRSAAQRVQDNLANWAKIQELKEAEEAADKERRAAHAEARRELNAVAGERARQMHRLCGAMAAAARTQATAVLRALDSAEPYLMRSIPREDAGAEEEEEKGDGPRGAAATEEEEALAAAAGSSAPAPPPRPARPAEPEVPRTTVRFRNTITTKEYEVESEEEGEEGSGAPPPLPASRPQSFPVKRPPGSPQPPLVPPAFEVLLTFLESEGLATEGIFRIPGSGAAVKAIEQRLGDQDLELTSEDPHTVASAVKGVLRNMKEPLLTSALAPEWIALGAKADRTALAALVDRLPPDNKRVCARLFPFLSVVAMNSPVNKMDATNLAVCFGPNLIPLTNPMDIKAVNSCVAALITNADIFF